MEKKVLVIGFGSIGRKHISLLRNLKIIGEIRVISQASNCRFKKINFLKRDILAFNPDYIIIANETYKHYKSLLKINSIVKNKVILVEKPLFHKYFKIKFKKRNKIFVAYNLRFSPLVEILKKILNKYKFNFISAECYTNVTKWRKNITFKKSYSSSKKKGGGVALDLSHEIDILQYLIGKFQIISSINKKISKIHGDVDDILIFTAKKKRKIIQLILNYFSKVNSRKILAIGKKYSLKLDFKNDFVLFKTDNKTQKIIIRNNIDKSYLKMHLSVLNNKNTKKLCSFEEGLNVNKIINSIKTKS